MIINGRLSALLCVTLLCCGAPATAAEQGVTLNLKDADIRAVISTISELTGKNFIVDPRVKGKVTIISSRPMDKSQVYQVFLSLLQVQGFAAVPAGGVVKIVPALNARQDSVPLSSVEQPGRGDEVVTRVVQVQHINAAQLVPILRPLLPQQAHLAAHAGSNSIIISDRAANADRIVEIIRRIDQPSEGEIDVIPLQHASAAEVVRVLSSLERSAGKKPDATEGPFLVADERTNSVLLSGDKAKRLRLRAIITHLDVPTASTGNTQVVYLRYAKAADLAAVLSGVGRDLDRDKQAKKEVTQPSELNIQADESANALVISASPEPMKTLMAVIRRLDVRRAQVLVEAIIAEVSSDKAAELGVQWGIDGRPGENGILGVVNFSGFGSGLTNLVTDAPTISDGATVGVGDFTSSDVRFGALIRALEGDADTNILSTPTLVTLDNEEAEIVVGKNVPFVTGQFTNTGTSGSSVTPFQTIERKDVGLSLKVKPQINEGNAIKLDIEQEVSSISSSTSGATDLVTNKRSIKTSVLVEDGQMVVLGGLIDDSYDETTQKIPGLGDVPMVGGLFRYQGVKKVKRSLMVFLRPVILRDPALATQFASSKYSYIRGQQLLARERKVRLLAGEHKPLLPLSPEHQSAPRRRPAAALPPMPRDGR